MKTVRRKYTQKGFSPIVIILIIVGVLVGGGILFIRLQKGVDQTRVTSTREGKDSPASTQNTENLLEKVETQKYVFYYPKKFTANQSYQQATLYYTHSNIQADYAKIGYGIALITEELKSRAKVPNYDVCNGLAKFMYSDEPTFKMLKINSFDLEKTHGCEVLASNSIDGDENGKKLRDEVIHKTRIQWYKAGDDLNLYYVQARYFVTEPKELTEALDLAVDKFVFK